MDFPTIADTVKAAVASGMTELIIFAAITYGGWFGRWIFRTKESREALHSALYSGLNLVTSELIEMTSSKSPRVSEDEIADRVVTFTKASVPDAIKFLKAPDSVLKNLALSFIRPRLAELMFNRREQEPSAIN